MWYFCNTAEFFEVFSKIFLSFHICFCNNAYIEKTETDFSGFLFCLYFCVLLYAAKCPYVADCKRHRKKDKIGNDFSGFSKCSDLISEQVKRKQFWLLNNSSAFFAAMYTGFPYTDKDKQTIFQKSFKFFLLTLFSGWFSL